MCNTGLEVIVEAGDSGWQHRAVIGANAIGEPHTPRMGAVGRSRESLSVLRLGLGNSILSGK